VFVGHHGAQRRSAPANLQIGGSLDHAAAFVVVFVAIDVQLHAEGLVPPRLMERCRELTVVDPDAALEQFAGASLVLAMRLHGLILAALAGAPCAALSYDPKVAAAAAAIGCPLQVLGEPVGSGLVASWAATLDHPPSVDRVASLRQDSQLHARVLQRLLLSHSGVSTSQA
jgi:polysaccharide pyruvyl transferase WcaK-like protein